MRSAPEMEFDIEGTRHRLEVRRNAAGWHVTVDGRTILVDARRVGDRWSLLLDPGVPDGSHIQGGSSGSRAWISHELTVEPRAPGELVVRVDGHPVPLSRPQTRRAGALRSAGGGAGPAVPQQLVAPMPGRIVKVLVRPGDEVQARQPLVVIEAMKMENELRAGRGGTVAEVLVSEGALVEARAVLVALR